MAKEIIMLSMLQFAVLLYEREPAKVSQYLIDGINSLKNKSGVIERQKNQYYFKLK